MDVNALIVQERELSYSLFALSLDQNNGLENPFMRTRLNPTNFDPNTNVPMDLIIFKSFGIVQSHITENNIGSIPTQFFDIGPRSANVRLKNVLHEIGHLILLYGLIDDKEVQNHVDHKSFKYLKIDSILYQIGMLPGLDGNLYARSIGCFHGTDSLTQTQCIELSEDDQKKRDKFGTGPYKTFDYNKMIEAIEDVTPSNMIGTGQAMVLNAMTNLFMSQGKMPQSTKYQNANGDRTQLMQALIAGEMAIGTFCETIRSPDTLPTTLKLITLMEAKARTVETLEIEGNAVFTADTDYSQIYFSKVHPMTRGGSWVFIGGTYKLYMKRKIRSVGFYPNVKSANEFGVFWSRQGLQGDAKKVAKLMKGKRKFYEKSGRLIELIDDDFEQKLKEPMGLIGLFAKNYNNAFFKSRIDNVKQWLGPKLEM